MWYDDKDAAEQQPQEYIGIWYKVSDGEVIGQPIGYQTAENHPRETEQLMNFIHDKMLGRLGRTENEQIADARRYYPLVVDICKFELGMDDLT